MLAKHFDFTGRQLRILGAFRATTYTAFGPQHEFTAYAFRGGECFRGIRIDNHLHPAFAVAQVDENDATVVAATVCPANQGDFLIQVACIQFSTIMCTHGHL